MMMIAIFLINTIFILNLRELAFPHQYQFDGNSNLVYTIIRQVTDTETQRRIKRPGFGIFLLSDSTSDNFDLISIIITVSGNVPERTLNKYTNQLQDEIEEIEAFDPNSNLS